MKIHYIPLLLPTLLVYCRQKQHPIILIPFYRVTGAAVQVTCELRSGKHNNRAMKSDLSFSRMELLECLWEDGNPQYTEVGVTATLTLGLCSRLSWYTYTRVWLNNKWVSSLWLCFCPVASIPKSWYVHSWDCTQTMCSTTLQPQWKAPAEGMHTQIHTILFILLISSFVYKILILYQLQNIDLL